MQIPDRAALGMASHMDAAKGAYVIRPFDEDRPREGTLIIEGTSTMESIMELLPKFQSDKSMPNVKLVCATSYELFQLQTKEYKDSILHKSEWLDSTVISNGCKMGMHPWLASKIAEGYAMAAGHDNRWRVGGLVAEVKRNAKIDWVALEEDVRALRGITASTGLPCRSNVRIEFREPTASANCGGLSSIETGCSTLGSIRLVDSTATRRADHGRLHPPSPGQGQADDSQDGKP